jgi:hypothetical protein
VQLSRARLLLRVALLLACGILLIGRGWRARGEAGWGDVAALLPALLGALALLTAAGAALSLRRRPVRRTLRLGDLGDGHESPRGSPRSDRPGEPT